MFTLIFQAIFLGIVQGLTEFLPISSSAHLVFLQEFFPYLKENALKFDLILHLGTLLALIVFFLEKFKLLFSCRHYQERNYFLKVILAVIITGLLVYPFKNLVEQLFQKPKLAGLMLIVTALFLFFASRKKNNQKKRVDYKESIIIGTLQALSVFPGISRSGITISSGILAGLESKTAFDFSFLMAVPLILGASLVEFSGFDFLVKNFLPVAFFGFIFSFLFGLIALKFLKKLILNDNRKLIYFALYCFFFGLFILIVI